MRRVGRRSSFALLVVLSGSLACAPAAAASVTPGDGTPPPGAASESHRPATSESGSTATSAPVGPGECARVIGYSVTNDWWSAGFEELPGIDEDSWEAVFVFGEMLPRWADPDFRGWTGDVKRGVRSASCDESPSRLVVQIAHLGFAQASNPEMLDLLEQVIDNAREHYPELERIDLIPIVGGPRHRRCPGVMATRMHPRMDAIIASAVDGEEIFAGPDLRASSCRDFRDATGHLSDSGASHVAHVMARRFGG